jgi:hypothetical protein
MKIPEHLKDEELVYYHSSITNDYYYAFIKNGKRSVGKTNLNNLLPLYPNTVIYTLQLKGKILLRAPLKDFLTLYPEHFL